MRSCLAFALALALVAGGLTGCVGTAEDASPTSAGESASEPDEDKSEQSAEESFDPGWPALEDAEIRPGIGIHNITATLTAGEEAWDCTSNFLFSSPDNRTLYLGLASHCVEESISGFVPIGGTVEIGDEVAYGTLVYSSWRTLENVTEDPGFEQQVANDFALVELPEDVREMVHPAVRWWGGPTGLATGTAEQGDHVLAYENSWNHRYEQRATNRNRGVVTEAEEDRTYFHAGQPSIYGDSGSPVLSADGEALAVVNTWNRQTQETGASNLAPALAFMEEHTNLSVELKTWPQLHELPVAADEPADPGPAGDPITHDRGTEALLDP